MEMTAKYYTTTSQVALCHYTALLAHRLVLSDVLEVTVNNGKHEQSCADDIQY